MLNNYLALNLRGKKVFQLLWRAVFYQCGYDRFIVFNYSDAVQAFLEAVNGDL